MVLVGQKDGYRKVVLNDKSNDLSQQFKYVKHENDQFELYSKVDDFILSEGNTHWTGGYYTMLKAKDNDYYLTYDESTKKITNQDGLCLSFLFGPELIWHKCIGAVTTQKFSLEIEQSDCKTNTGCNDKSLATLAEEGRVYKFSNEDHIFTKASYAAGTTPCPKIETMIDGWPDA